MELPARGYRAAAVRRVNGVNGVKRFIKPIAVEPQAKPNEVKRRIEEALTRSAEIDASRVAVEVDGGEVVLSGAMRGWAERREAERAGVESAGDRKDRQSAGRDGSLWTSKNIPIARKGLCNRR
jgi:osmotically-inducible protein OsmY